LNRALQVAGKMGKMNIIDFSFDWNNRYNVWSGIIGGFFLQLSYFGTDQSQVGRYLTGSSVTQSRLGLLLNGLIKIPMQFFILLIGILVFTFYQFNPAPLFFNTNEVEKIKNSEYAEEFKTLEAHYEVAATEKSQKTIQLSEALEDEDAQKIAAAKQELTTANEKANELRISSIELMKKNSKVADTNDTNYVFLYFVTHHMPAGLIGLLVAVIFLASMGSLAAGLNSLASSTAVDIYMRSVNKKGTKEKYLAFSRWATLAWGIFCILSALFVGKAGNLIEVVNIIGSLFYGTILGIFLVAFYFKKINGTAVFYAAIATELLVIMFWYFNVMAFLWLNVVGCISVIMLAHLVVLFYPPFISKK
jgi:SSS family solute:Na+ symporter